MRLLPVAWRVAFLLVLATPAIAATPSRLLKLPGAKPRNVIFILSDDHRHDALGFLHPWLKTPHLDALARGGAHMRNAFVTTALCSPSRATILTGLYAHKHRVVDNNNPIPPGTTFFPQHLQRAGYETAFVGKWHMGGEGDDPKPGFDRWVSFAGQGSYLPTTRGLNVDGKRVPQKGYITDELTDYALDWLKGRTGKRPFFLYLSHKGVHADFVPADRHKGRYKDQPFTPPKTMAAGPQGRPMWVQNQRNSWHGIEFAYHEGLDVAAYYRRYLETLMAVDDSVGRVMEHLRARDLLRDTLIIYMGDNGFAFGEHGLIDKRTAYEVSMRVPLLVHCPALIAGPRTMTQLITNLDIAPTILEAAGLVAPKTLDGRSFLPLFRDETAPWRTSFLYEYYWERNFPQTPTIFALRTDRWKFVRAHGVWDLDELYDLQADPDEARNLIDDPTHQRTVAALKEELFRTLRDTDGMHIPLFPDKGRPNNLRARQRSQAAEFPPEMIKPTPAAAGTN